MSTKRTISEIRLKQNTGRPSELSISYKLSDPNASFPLGNREPFTFTLKEDPKLSTDTLLYLVDDKNGWLPLSLPQMQTKATQKRNAIFNHSLDEELRIRNLPLHSRYMGPLHPLGSNLPSTLKKKRPPDLEVGKDPQFEKGEMQGMTIHCMPSLVSQYENILTVTSRRNGRNTAIALDLLNLAHRARQGGKTLRSSELFYERMGELFPDLMTSTVSTQASPVVAEPMTMEKMEDMISQIRKLVDHFPPMSISPPPSTRYPFPSGLDGISNEGYPLYPHPDSPLSLMSKDSRILPKGSSTLTMLKKRDSQKMLHINLENVPTIFFDSFLDSSDPVNDSRDKPKKD